MFTLFYSLIALGETQGAITVTAEPLRPTKMLIHTKKQPSTLDFLEDTLKKIGDLTHKQKSKTERLLKYAHLNDVQKKKPFFIKPAASLKLNNKANCKKASKKNK